MKRHDDHGSGGGRAWQNESGTLLGTVIMGSVLLGQQPAHDHDGDRRGGCHDHGSGAPGPWQNKSENLGPADRAHRLIIEWTANL
jgi:hypothetical protein